MADAKRQGWREDRGWSERQQGTAAHWRERDEKGGLTKAEESLIYFIQWILKTLKRGAWRSSLLDLFHTLSLSLSLSRSLSRAAIHTFSLGKHIRHTFTPSDVPPQLRNISSSVSPVHWLSTLLSLSLFNQSDCQSVVQLVSNKHTHAHKHTNTLTHIFLLQAD